MVVALGKWSLEIPALVMAGGAFVLALWITWLSIPSIIRVAVARGLYDRPNERSAHSRDIPTLGGMAVFAGFTISASVFAGLFLSRELLFLIAGLIILFFVGIKDDILMIDPYKKFIGQLFAAFLVVMGGGIRIASLYGFFGVDTLGYMPGVLLTVFVLVVIINGFNFIDGIDGLAAGSALLGSLIFGSWFMAKGFGAYGIIAFAFTGTLLAFLRFNLSGGRHKIFLGDTGSMILGLIMAVLAVRFMECYQLLRGGDSGVSPVLAMTVLLLPLADMLRTVFRRVIRGTPISRAEKTHIHHVFLEKGFSHFAACAVLLGTNLLIFLLIFFLRSLEGTVLLMILFSVTFFLLVLLSIWRRKGENASASREDHSFQPSRS